MDTFSLLAFVFTPFNAQEATSLSTNDMLPDALELVDNGTQHDPPPRGNGPLFCIIV